MVNEPDSDDEELDGQSDTEFIPKIYASANDDPYPTIAKKREILDFFRKRKGSKEDKFKKAKHKFRLLSSVRLLYKWENQLKNGKHLSSITNLIFCYF